MVWIAPFHGHPHSDNIIIPKSSSSSIFLNHPCQCQMTPLLDHPHPTCFTLHRYVHAILSATNNEPALLIWMIDLGSSYFKVSVSRTYASFFTFCTIRTPHDQVRYGKCLRVYVNMLITFTSQTPFCCCHRRLDRCKGRTTCDISAVSRRMAGVSSNDRTRSTCHAMV